MRLPFNGNYPVTQRFNDSCCRASYAQFGMTGHNGIDYGLPSGTPVVAAEDGVAYVKSDPAGFGNYVEVFGPHKTIYAHLQGATVASGTRVAAGQQIGISDNTGNSSGAHLHFGVKPLNPDNNNGFFGAIDPQPLFNQGDEMIPDANHLQALFRAFRGRDATADEVKRYVGAPYSGMVEALNGGPERDATNKALAVGKVAVRDKWDQQIFGLQAKVSDLNARIADLEERLSAADEIIVKLQDQLQKLQPQVPQPGTTTPQSPPDNVALDPPTNPLASMLLTSIVALKALYVKLNGKEVS